MVSFEPVRRTAVRLRAQPHVPGDRGFAPRERRRDRARGRRQRRHVGREWGRWRRRRRRISRGDCSLHYRVQIEHTSIDGAMA